jgi:hypothetical protein
MPGLKPGMQIYRLLWTCVLCCGRGDASPHGLNDHPRGHTPVDVVEAERREPSSVVEPAD